MRTMQQTFNEVWEGLKSQGFARSRRSGSCSYRGDFGRKCAIGHLIPDALYCESLDTEGKAVLDFADFELAKYGLEVSDTPDADSTKSFLYALQEAHDLANSPGEVQSLLMDVARRFNLEVPNE
jgi:hypothetical protein